MSNPLSIIEAALKRKAAEPEDPPQPVFEKVRKDIVPEVKVLSDEEGTVEYVASDETLDASREVVKANGWVLDGKNIPFVDSHNYSSVANQLGMVTDTAVKGKKLIATVKFAIGVPEMPLATAAFKMVKAGFLKACSVGFAPLKMLTKWDEDPSKFNKVLLGLGLQPADAETVRAIYTQQKLIELSAVVVGCNPNALARAYKDTVLTEEDLTRIGEAHAKTFLQNQQTNTDSTAINRARAERVIRERDRFMADFFAGIQKAINQ